MKSLLQILFFLLLLTHLCFGQWYQQNSGTNHDLYSVQFINSNIGYAVGDSGTIINTNDGGITWQAQISGTDYNLKDVFFIDPNHGCAVGNFNSYPLWGGIVLYTSDAGINWTTLWTKENVTLNSIYFIDSLRGWIAGDTSMIGGAQSEMWYTTDGGLTWTIRYKGVPPHVLNSIYFIDPNNGWAVGGGDTILCTTDSGLNWIPKAINFPIPLIYVDSRDVYFIDVNTGWIAGPGLILKTTDGGENWVIKWYEPRYETGWQSLFFVSPTNGWVVGYNISGAKIRSTTDGGDTWIEQSSGISPWLYSINLTADSSGWIVGEGGIILHTTNGGVPVEFTSFTTTSNGKEVILNWTTATELNNQGFEIQRMTEGSEFFTIGFIEGNGTTTGQHNYTYSDKLLDNGKYYYRLKQVDFDGSYEYSIVAEVDFKAFSSFLLEQNYPNPFNPATTISFGIQNKSNVKITILNAIGEEVAVVLNEEKDAGYHKVEFNAANLPSGVYFYQLKAGNYADTKKMILMK